MPRQAAADHRAGEHVQRGEQGSGAVAWIWLFSSMHSTTAWSGGLSYRPTTSMSVSSKHRSLESVKVFTRWGLSPRADQIRATVAELTPARLAIDRHDQCVWPSGAASLMTLIACHRTNSSIELFVRVVMVTAPTAREWTRGYPQIVFIGSDATPAFSEAASDPLVALSCRIASGVALDGKTARRGRTSSVVPMKFCCPRSS